MRQWRGSVIRHSGVMRLTKVKRLVRHEGGVLTFTEKKKIAFIGKQQWRKNNEMHK